MIFSKKKKQEREKHIQNLIQKQEVEIYKWLNTLGRERIQRLNIEHHYDKYQDKINSNVYFTVNTFEERDILYQNRYLDITFGIDVANTSDYENYNLRVYDKKFNKGEISIESYAKQIMASDYGYWASKLIVEEYLKRIIEEKKS